VADRYSLKTRFTFAIFPRDIKHIRLEFARNDSKAVHLVTRIGGGLSVDPGSVERNRCLLWKHRLYFIELNVGLRQLTVGRFLSFQEDRQNFNRSDHFIRHVRQFQEYSRFRIQESKGKGMFGTVFHGDEILFDGGRITSTLSGV
jgi:hypothetical protein